VAGVDDLVAVVLVVLVAARDDDRVGALVLRAGDARDERAMNACRRSVGATGERRPVGDPAMGPKCRGIDDGSR
jgi:hypothetical protein